MVPILGGGGAETCKNTLRFKLTRDKKSTDYIDNGVFRFTGQTELVGLPRDDPQRSDREPPDKGWFMTAISLYGKCVGNEFVMHICFFF